VKTFMTKWVATLLLVMPLDLLADDMDDVMAVIEAYGNLEGDLAAQAELMHPDRVYITGGMRQTNESLNMRNQIATREAQEALNGGKTEFVTTIEDVDISIYGDVAVASFVRWWNVYPANQAPVLGAPTWVSLVLIKEGSDWLIKHTHQSPVRGG
jgi:UDP-N-acetylmuramyl pentapeptide synthase